MSGTNRIVVVLGVGLILLVLQGRSVVASSHDKDEGSVKIDFPREDSVKVHLHCGPVELRSVKIENAPSHEEIKKARHDRDDTTRLHWVFKVDNEGKHKRKLTIHVTVYSEHDEALAEDSGEDTIDEGTEGDHISVWTKILTIEYPKADHARIAVECERD
jgi:hypothetical protein